MESEGGEQARSSWVLTVDFGSQKTMASLVKVGEEGSTSPPFLVHNDLSRFETPTEVSFRGKTCETGELAAMQPATNAHNVVKEFVPYVGLPPREVREAAIAPGFRVSDDDVLPVTCAAVEFDGSDSSFPLELVLARHLEGVVGCAKHQLVEMRKVPSKDAADIRLAVILPGCFTPRQARALEDACRIAGVEDAYLVPAHQAMAQGYEQRHKPEIEQMRNSSVKEQTIAIVDVGHMISSCAIVRFTPGESKIVSAKSIFGVGGAAVDSILVSHFKEDIERKYGSGCCESPRSLFRLRAACEKLKKMLSTIDESEVGVDGLLPERDVTIKLTRHRLNEMIAPLCHQLQELVKSTLQTEDSFIEGSSLDGVEIIGGASRIPCLAAVVQSAFDGKELRKTLDSNSALCIGAANPAAQFFDPAVSQEKKDCNLQNALKSFDVKGLEESHLKGLREKHMEISEMQAQLRRLEVAMNNLESKMSETREALRGKHAHLMKRDETESALKEVEEWLEQVPQEGYSVEMLEKKKEELELKVRELNSKMFEQLEKQADEMSRSMERSAQERRQEEANQDKDDHDFRKLRFDERVRMAENNKKEANELFRDGNVMHAIDRYNKAIGHCMKIVETLRPEQEKQLNELKGVIVLNLAQAFFKLNKFQKCIDNCNDCLRYSPSLSKAKFRRALAYEQMNLLDEAEKDAKVLLEEEPENPNYTALSKRLGLKLQKRLDKEKNICKKMFG
uniref:Uncharacterized protein n=1 Tax=Guillardia theta TaxID=55529 RepID=A0A7S4JD62_GUITH